MPKPKGNKQRSIEELRLKQTNWETGLVRESLARKPEELTEFRNGSGDFVIKRVYTPLDTAKMD